MAFEMAGWQTQAPKLACPGGIPFSNAIENNERNTVTTAPAAELAMQLYRAHRHRRRTSNSPRRPTNGCAPACCSPAASTPTTSPQGRPVEPALWSYNQGSMIGAGTLLYQATGNQAYL